MSFTISFYLISLRILKFLSAPVFALIFRSRKRALPPIENDLLKLSATALAAKIRHKEITSVEIVRIFLERIHKVNALINAVADRRFDDALEEAKVADRLVAQKTADELLEKYPLLGVPFTVKENIGVKGLQHACGVKARVGIRAREDADVVTVLRAAGAIPICVTNASEYCLSWETITKLSGRVGNPYNLGRTAGGSAGGEAALLASGGSPFGIATDMGGAIRMPAHHCGIFGHKPTNGLISLEGVYPEPEDDTFKAYNTVGVMARHAEDLKTCLRILSENSPELLLDEKVKIRDIKIYYKKEFESYFMQGVKVDNSIKSIINDALNFFTVNGNSVEACTIDMTEAAHIGSILYMALYTSDLMYCMKENGEHDSLLWELIKCLFGQSNYSFNALSLTAAYRLRVFIPKSMVYTYDNKLLNLRRQFMKMLKGNAVLIIPSFPVPAFRHYESQLLMSGTIYTQCVNLMGFPSTHVPMGLNKAGLPVGFQVISAPSQDRLCLAVACELEKYFGGWVHPS